MFTMAILGVWRVQAQLLMDQLLELDTLRPRPARNGREIMFCRFGRRNGSSILFIDLRTEGISERAPLSPPAVG